MPNFRVFAVLLNLWVIAPFLKPWKAVSLHLGKYSHGFLIYRIQMITLACSSSLSSVCREACNHSFFSPLSKSALPWVPPPQMPQWLNGSSRAQQGRSCPEMISFSVPYPCHSEKLPCYSACLGNAHPLRALRAEVLASFWRGGGWASDNTDARPMAVWSVAVEWKMRWKECFSQKPYIMELPAAGESGRQMAMSKQVHPRDELEWEGVKRQKLLAAADKGKRPTGWNPHGESQGGRQKAGPMKRD